MVRWMKNISYMREAIAQAKEALVSREIPVGAVLVHKNLGIVAIKHNLVETNHDALAHAEKLAIEEGCLKLGTRYLTDCDLYSTLEPCPMCAYAIMLARIRRLYFAAYDSKFGAVENGIRLFEQKNCNHKPEIYGGIMEENSRKLLDEFFCSLRA